MAYKLFSTGEVLTAANVNNYLMNQTVMVFASAAARTTALSGVLAEGMISYRTDSHVLEVYNGTAWVASETNLTTKGDLAVYSTVPDRLPVGSDGQTLVANSSASTGVSWATPVGSLANPVINGGFDIWQRGTSVAVAASTVAYTADRLSILTAASQASTVSRQATGDTTNLPNIQYCARVQRNSGQTGTGTMYVANSIETTNSIPYTGKAVTVSFYARAGANYSATSNALNLYLWNGTGTDQNVNGGYTGANVVGSVTATLTTTWQRFSFTGTVPTNSTELALQYQNVPTGTAGVNDYYDITGVQIDLGTYTATTAPAFRRSGGTVQGELAACQRYYYRIVNPAFTGSNIGISNYGSAATTGFVGVTVSQPVTMRTAPASIDYSSNLVVSPDELNTSIAVSAVSLSAFSDSNNLSVLATVTGATQYRPYRLYGAASTTYLGFSAEL